MTAEATSEGDVQQYGEASLTKLGFIDEYQLHLRPVVLGRGSPYFVGAQPPLRLVASDHIGEDAMRLTYVPA